MFTRFSGYIIISVIICLTIFSLFVFVKNPNLGIIDLSGIFGTVTFMGFGFFIIYEQWSREISKIRKSRFRQEFFCTLTTIGTLFFLGSSL